MALFCLSLFEEKTKPPTKEARQREQVKKTLKKKDSGVQVVKRDERREQERKRERDKPRDAVIPDTDKILRVAILIDDIGQDLGALRELLEINAPLSFAVLPLQPHSAEAAKRIHLKNRDILLHLPMEPKSYPEDRPGNGALFLSMTDKEIRTQFQSNLETVPHAKGVNNHMGSRFTEDTEKMLVVMTELKEKGLFFVDSRTTKDSKAKEAANKIGVPFLARRIFIDNDRNYQVSLENLTRWLENPGMQGSSPVLFIGHPYPSTILAIRDAISSMRAKGIEIVPISKIVPQ